MNRLNQERNSTRCPLHVQINLMPTFWYSDLHQAILEEILSVAVDQSGPKNPISHTWTYKSTPLKTWALKCVYLSSVICINSTQKKPPRVFYFTALWLLRVWFWFDLVMELKEKYPQWHRVCIHNRKQDRKLHQNGSTFFEQQGHDKDSCLASALFEIGDIDLSYPWQSASNARRNGPF